MQTFYSTNVMPKRMMQYKKDRVSLSEEGSVDLPIPLLQLQGIDDCNDDDDNE
jgi:hypothetical protein